MVLLECSPPFQWKPSLRTDIGDGWRFMWGWFAVAYVPYGFGEYIEGLAQAGIELYDKGEIEIRR
jgi:hypothetical protein